MWIRNFFRHLRDAFRNIRRNALTAFGSMFSISLILLLVGVFLAVLLNLNKLATDVANNVSVSVYIDQAAKQADVKKLEKDLKDIPNVDKVTFRSKEEELNDIIGSYGDAFDLFDGDSNPLYDVFVVDANASENTKAVATTAEKLSYVAKVNYGGSDADQLFSMVKNFRNIGIGISAALIIVAIFLISNTTRLAIAKRATEIEIQRLVGAKNSYIRAPFFIEGFLIGLVGAAIPIGILWYSYQPVVSYLTKLLTGSNMTLIPTYPFLLYLSGLLALIGIVIGSFGSAFSMGRYIRK